MDRAGGLGAKKRGVARLRLENFPPRGKVNLPVSSVHQQAQGWTSEASPCDAQAVSPRDRCVLTVARSRDGAQATVNHAKPRERSDDGGHRTSAEFERGDQVSLVSTAVAHTDHTAA